MHITCEEIGQIVQKTRKSLGLRQRDLALVSGVGIRFIVDLEKGKQTCQVGKVLLILKMLGIYVTLELPKVYDEK